jgi:peptidoglycan hydrolase CwlO-like protein
MGQLQTRIDNDDVRYAKISEQYNEMETWKTRLEKLERDVTLLSERIDKHDDWQCEQDKALLALQGRIDQLDKPVAVARTFAVSSFNMHQARLQKIEQEVVHLSRKLAGLDDLIVIVGAHAQTLSDRGSALDAHQARIEKLEGRIDALSEQIVNRKS